MKEDPKSLLPRIVLNWGVGFGKSRLKFLSIIAALLLGLQTGCLGQNLDSLLFVLVNEERGPRHRLAYDSSKQAKVNAYAQTRMFLSMTHSSIRCDGEILVKTYSVYDFIPSWKDSKPHRQHLKSPKFKSMVCRVVKLKENYYAGVVQFFYEMPQKTVSTTNK